MPSPPPGLHYDNTPVITPVHMPAFVQETLTNINLPTIAHPPNSPDLATYAFHLFPNLKHDIRGNGYYDAEEMTRDVKFKHVPNMAVMLAKCTDKAGKCLEKV